MFIPPVEALVDSYKIGMNLLHDHEFFKDSPTSVKMSYSNFTPRKNAYMTFSEHSDGKLTVFGTQHAFKRIHDLFEVFFKTSRVEVEARMVIRLTSHFGGDVRVDHAKYISDILGLHDLGFLPLEIRAIDEGVHYPIGLPLFTSKNTIDGYGWLVNNLETLSSNLAWPMINNATKIDQFYQQAKHYGAISTPKEILDFWLPVSVHNFEMRGMFGDQHALMAGAASCIPFIGSDTIGTIDFLEYYYGYNPSKDAPLCVSVRASEHADITRLLSEFRYRGITQDTESHVIAALARHTTGIFSYVADSENYFRTISEYAIANRDAILARQDGANGLPAKWVWRADSSRLRPLEVICGLDDTQYTIDKNGKYRENIWLKDSKGQSYNELGKELSELEVKGSLQILWEVFGGVEVATEAGKMKLINPKVGLIYGEAISQKHQKEIYTRMIELGFSVSNLIIGKGSYANLENNTRDLFSISYKQTFSTAFIDGVLVNLEQQKIPMGDESKKSDKGLLKVVLENGVYIKLQGVTEEEEQTGELKLLFRNSVFYKNQTIWGIKANYFA